MLLGKRMPVCQLPNLPPAGGQEGNPVAAHSPQDRPGLGPREARPPRREATLDNYREDPTKRDGNQGEEVTAPGPQPRAPGAVEGQSHTRVQSPAPSHSRLTGFQGGW